VCVRGVGSFEFVGIVVTLCFLCGERCSSLFSNIGAPHDSPTDAKDKQFGN
jgi:hypothetical protein